MAKRSSSAGAARYQTASALSERVPLSVLTALARAEKVAIVAHRPPDGDTLGSALGLQRTLATLGKEARVCLDDIIPGDLKQLDSEHVVVRPEHLAGQGFDLVVLVDVSDPARCGRILGLLDEAATVMVIDHHRVEIPEALKQRHAIVWNDPERDATALLIAGLAPRLLAGVPEEEPWRNIVFPLLAGIFTDTGGFRNPGVSRETVRVFEALLRLHNDGDIRSLIRRLTYRLPVNARRLLRGQDVDLPEPPQSRWRALKDQGLAFTVEHVGDVVLSTCSRPLFELALDVARLDDPEANEYDVRGFLLHDLDRTAGRASVAVLIYENQEELQVSVRSNEPGPARALAESLGGGGHDRKAAAQPAISLTEAKTRVAAWAREFNENQGLRSKAPSGM